MSQLANGGYVVVGRYSLPGNMSGGYTEHVLPLLGNDSSTPVSESK